MSNIKIANVLKAHGIEYRIINDSIIAYNYYTFKGCTGCELCDLTGYTLQGLLEFLGY